jgi:hypothetical protein
MNALSQPCPKSTLVEIRPSNLQRSSQEQLPRMHFARGHGNLLPPSSKSWQTSTLMRMRAQRERERCDARRDCKLHGGQIDSAERGRDMPTSTVVSLFVCVAGRPSVHSSATVHRSVTPLDRVTASSPINQGESPPPIPLQLIMF